MPNRTLITVWGKNPPIAFPGNSEDSAVGRPNRYLMGPALVIPQDTSRVPIVDRISTTGKDPETKIYYKQILFSCFQIVLTEVGIPGGPGSDDDEDLLVGQIERHRQLAQSWQPGEGSGDQLSRHAVHADDEHPLSEPSEYKDFQEYIYY